MVAEGLPELDGVTVVDAQTLRVRDKEFVRVPEPHLVLVTVPEPLLEGLREMVRDTVAVRHRVGLPEAQGVAVNFVTVEQALVDTLCVEEVEPEPDEVN